MREIPTRPSLECWLEASTKVHFALPGKASNSRFRKLVSCHFLSFLSLDSLDSCQYCLITCRVRIEAGETRLPRHSYSVLLLGKLTGRQRNKKASTCATREFCKISLIWIDSFLQWLAVQLSSFQCFDAKGPSDISIFISSAPCTFWQRLSTSELTLCGIVVPNPSHAHAMRHLVHVSSSLVFIHVLQS